MLLAALLLRERLSLASNSSSIVEGGGGFSCCCFVIHGCTSLAALRYCDDSEKFVSEGRVKLGTAWSILSVGLDRT